MHRIGILCCLAITLGMAAVATGRSIEMVTFGGRVWGTESSGATHALQMHKGVLRFEVRDHDRRHGDGDTRERAEIRMPRELRHGQAVEAIFDLKVAQIQEGHRFQIFHQWHTKTATGWRPWLALYSAGSGDIRIVWSASAITRDGLPVTNVMGEKLVRNNVGEWAKYQIEVRTGRQDGRLVVRVNDKIVVCYTGPIGYFETPNNHMGKMGYMKLGIYRWKNGGSKPTVVMAKNLEMTIH